MVGHPDGKMSDDEIKSIGDRYGDSAVSYFNNFQKSDTTSSSRTPADANLPHPFLAGNPGALDAIYSVFKGFDHGTGNHPGFNPGRGTPMAAPSPMAPLMNTWGQLGGVMPPNNYPVGGSPEMSADAAQKIDPTMLMNLMNVANQMPQNSPGR